MNELLPLAAMVAAIAIASWVGDLVTKKTGRKLIGWPFGVALFLVLVAISGALLP